MRSPELLQFAQRVSSDFHLKPLTPSEVKELHQLPAQGGGCEAQLFSDEACLTIAHASQGIPRTINILCDTALDLWICRIGRVDHARNCNNGHRKQVAIWRAAADRIASLNGEVSRKTLRLPLLRRDGFQPGLNFALQITIRGLAQAPASVDRMPWQAVRRQYSSCPDDSAPERDSGQAALTASSRSGTDALKSPWRL